MYYTQVASYDCSTPSDSEGNMRRLLFWFSQILLVLHFLNNFHGCLNKFQASSNEGMVKL